MRQRPGDEVGEELLDNGVAAVHRLCFDQTERGVGEYRVIPVGRQQLCLAVDRLQASDPAHDQPGGDPMAGFGFESGVGDFGALSVGDPFPGVLVVDRVGVADRGPGVLSDAGDRSSDLGVHAGGDREPQVVAAGRCDEFATVVSGVGAGDDVADLGGGAHGVGGFGEQDTRAAARAGGAAPQAGRHGDRSGDRSGRGCDQAV